MKTVRCFVLALSLLIDASSATATTIFYSVANVGGNTYEYAYRVDNDSLGTPLEEFTIFFDLALYENLHAAAAPAGWDPLVIQPDLILGDDGFFDTLAIAPGDALAPGEALAGFTVRFDWLAVGQPGSQPFEILDPLTFDLLDTGTTVPIPEPGPGLLIALGLIGFTRPFHTRRRAVGERARIEE